MEKSIIIFDGECNLCNGVVGWLLRNTDLDIFDFVPFQSTYGQEILSAHGFNTDTLETVVLLDDTGVHTLSDGFLKIIAKIPEWQPLSVLLSLVPRTLRDGVYKLAAKNRVRWFGKSQFCTVSLH
ncbi:thiol-disulfide oxidoreductase DCC family protein [Flagellimonas sp.]|uniref:thiol-disulfide oxidoreductase DCC family protein n=1 Tax=Flagellimonas sp. TaxID=2058762 RepID=UPI003F49EED2